MLQRGDGKTEQQEVFDIASFGVIDKHLESRGEEIQTYDHRQKPKVIIDVLKEHFAPDFRPGRPITVRKRAAILVQKIDYRP